MFTKVFGIHTVDSTGVCVCGCAYRREGGRQDWRSGSIPACPFDIVLAVGPSSRNRDMSVLLCLTYTLARQDEYQLGKQNDI